MSRSNTIWPVRSPSSSHSREENVSFEYHLAGAIAGVITAIAFYKLDPLPPRKRYSWEDEEDEAGEFDYRNELEPDRPRDVPVLWSGPHPRGGDANNVIAFPHKKD